VNLRIGIQFGDLGEDFRRCGIGGKDILFGMEAGLGAGIDLVAHINLRGRVLADQDHGQSRADALGSEDLGLLFEAGAKLLGQRITVEKMCSHDVSGAS